MTTIKALVSGGRVEIDVPSDWPDGTHVEIHPVPNDIALDETVSPEEIAELLRAIDAFEPLDLSADESAAWEAERLARRAWEMSQFADHAANLQRMWE